jgi:hypothetical protein
VRSITMALMPANPCPFGRTTDGSTQMILAAGFNGTAVTIWAGECLKKTSVKSSAGKRFEGMSVNCARIVSLETPFAALDSDKHCCIGLTIAGRFKKKELRDPIVRNQAVAVELRTQALVRQAERAVFGNTVLGGQEYGRVEILPSQGKLP